MNRVLRSALTIFTLLILSFYLKHTFALDPAYLIPKFKIDPKITSCAIINSTIDKKLNGFENSKAKHMEIYTKLVDRLEQMIEKWKERGYDVNKVEEDLNTINTMIDEYEQDYEDLKSKIENLKSLCGSDDYKTKLTEVKAALKELRKDGVDIRVFYQTVIRKDIKALKLQKFED